jgi:transcriptional repressor NrdR
MRCPKCGNTEDKVIDSRAAREGATIRRRRECLKCGYRFTTYEQVERARLVVLKRDGRREEFSKEKLFGGIQKACQKRPVSQEAIDDVVEDIMEELCASYDREVPCEDIGVRVMAQLRKLDPVAYVRYASVYRRFDEVTDFVQEVKKMEKPYDTLTARLPGI